MNGQTPLLGWRPEVPFAALALATLLGSPTAFASETFSGKCVGVTDGDTIKVLRDGRETKIRLEGIDCPETGDAFSAKAKKFTSACESPQIVLFQ